METNKKVFIKKPEFQNINVSIKGITPLLMERDDGVAAKIYEGKKSKKIVKEDTRSEEEKVESKIHKLSDGSVGYPSSGFSTGMRKVAYEIIGKQGSMIVKEGVRFLEPMIPIKYKKMEVTEHIGRQSGVSRCPRRILRPQFNEWSCILKIKVNLNIISIEQVINLINETGLRRGIGGFRPEKSGEYGQYEVNKDARN